MDTEKEQKIDNVIQIFADLEYQRRRAKNWLNREGMSMEDRKTYLLEDWYRLVLITQSFPYRDSTLQIISTKILGDIFLEFRDLKTAIFYYKVTVIIYIYIYILHIERIL